MENDITYIGINKEPEIHKKRRKEKSKIIKHKSHSIYLPKISTNFWRKLFNKKLISIILIIGFLYYFNPIIFLRNKLDEKREYYAQLKEESSNINIIDSFIYSLGAKYYKNCKNTMVMPADGLITYPFDLAHKGIDIACEEYQDNIYAAANGKVCYIGYSQKYGNELLIEHTINDMTIYTFYGNLSIINVTNGQYVTQNQVIAQEGGNPEKRAGIMDSTGHHLHFEVRKSKNSNSGLNPHIFIYN